jgi:hypothetical protein
LATVGTDISTSGTPTPTVLPSNFITVTSPRTFEQNNPGAIFFDAAFDSLGMSRDFGWIVIAAFLGFGGAILGWNVSKGNAVVSGGAMIFIFGVCSQMFMVASGYGWAIAIIGGAIIILPIIFRS